MNLFSLQVGVLLYSRHKPITPKGGVMAVWTALFCSCVVMVLTLVHGRGLPTDSLKNSIKLQAENIIFRIQKHKDEVNTKRSDYCFYYIIQ